MYFVTIKRAGYVLFCMTPSERAALGLTADNTVHLLTRAEGATWNVLRAWPVAKCSHTDFMAGLKNVAEPSDPAELVAYLPPELRS